MRYTTHFSRKKNSLRRADCFYLSSLFRTVLISGSGIRSLPAGSASANDIILQQALQLQLLQLLLLLQALLFLLQLLQQPRPSS